MENCSARQDKVRYFLSCNWLEQKHESKRGLLERAQQNPDGLKFSVFERLMRQWAGCNAVSEEATEFGTLLTDIDSSLNVSIDPQLYHHLTDEAAKAAMSLPMFVAEKLARTTDLDLG